MMRALSSSVFLFFILTIGTAQAVINITEECEFIGDRLPRCFWIGSQTVDVVITNQEQLKEFPFGSCDPGWFTDIDFSKYSILAKYIGGDVFEIIVDRQGGCEPLIMSWNLVKVAKIPEDYIVEMQTSTCYTSRDR